MVGTKRPFPFIFLQTSQHGLVLVPVKMPKASKAREQEVASDATSESNKPPLTVVITSCSQKTISKDYLGQPKPLAVHTEVTASAPLLLIQSITTLVSNQTMNSSSNSNNKAAAALTPDAMNQTIHRLMTQGNPQTTSKQITSLYTQSIQSLPEHRKKETIFTGIPAHFKYMPYPLPWRAIAGPDELPPDYEWITSSCAGKAVVGTLGGAACGLVMGVFLGAMSDMTPPVTVLNGKEVPQAPLREQMRTTLRATGEKSIYWARNFAFITGVFGASDCLVEKFRGKHDVWNEVLSGCVTGAAMQAKQGPQAAALGCGGFAVFSLIIDKVMH